jgi:hypothetical protein
LAEELLRAWAQAEKDGDRVALSELQERRRVRVGEIRVTPKGKGPEVARFIAGVFGRSPWNVDVGGVGASVYDYAQQVLRVDAAAVSFSGSAPDRLPGEHFCENVRAALYVRAAMLLDRGLVDAPDDILLRTELLAHELVRGAKSFETTRPDGSVVKERQESVHVLSKDDIRKKIGRSPDRSDAFVLALWRFVPPKPPVAGAITIR